jgi:hypothetical protein
MLAYVERVILCTGSQVIDRIEAFNVLDTGSREAGQALT